MKLIDLLQIRKIFAQNIETSLGIQTAYKIMKILDETQGDEKFFHDKVKVILEEYNAKEENGKIKLKPEYAEACNKKFEELYSTEVENPKYLFTLEELSLIKLTVLELNSIKCLIKD